MTSLIKSFGIHQATFIDLADNTMSTAYIIGDVGTDFSTEQVDNRGGSNPYPWDTASGEATGEITLTIKQYDKGIFRFFQPYTTTSIEEQASGDVSGYVSTIENIIGTSVVDAATGIASIAADPAGTLKFGEYYVKCPTDGATVDLYVDTDIDGQVYVDDSLKLTATPITIPTGSTVNSNGIQFTGGSGSIGMTEGDVARFNVRPINTYALTHYIGKQGACTRKFKLVIVSEALCNGQKLMRKLTINKAIANNGGMLNFPYKEWASFETTIKVLGDIDNTGYIAKQEIINR